MNDIPDRLSIITRWLQRENDELLYTPDGLFPQARPSDAFPYTIRQIVPVSPRVYVRGQEIQGATFVDGILHLPDDAPLDALDAPLDALDVMLRWDIE